MTTPLISVHGLKKHFPVRGSGLLRRDLLRAVDGVDFTVDAGETFGIVGESGCGKSTTGRLIVNLLKPTDGSIRVRGVDVNRVDAKGMRQIRRELQIVFQDPFGSLNPRMRVGAAIEEPLRCHRPELGRADRDALVGDLMERVGLNEADRRKYPHEFSGGQRQRICIARALSAGPSVIVCDEAVSALDVSIQAQILNLLQDLQDERNLTILFISHDLGVVKHISDRVCVMYAGRIVELCGREEIFTSSLHPYTQALLSAIPIPEPGRRNPAAVLKGDPPSAVGPRKGCAFASRCPRRMDVCEEVDPALQEPLPGHAVACHLYPSHV